MIRILNEKEIKSIVSLDLSVIAAIETGFSELDRGNALVPPIMMIPVPEKKGEVDIKSAYIKGYDQLAIKVASGFFENSRLGLPSQSGLMLVVSAETGFLQGVLLDNGYLTQVRTGAAGAVAAKFLAPQTADSVGVIGSGMQARFQMAALMLVRPFSTIRMFSLDPDDARDRYVRDMQRQLNVRVINAPSIEAVVKESAIVVTTTPARQGFIKAAWLHPGLHITAMGSDTEEKQELEADVLARADLVACDLKTQSMRLGELRSALAQNRMTADSPVAELGAIINGRTPGRSDGRQITVCDLTGVGVQDTMIAINTLKIATERNIGLTVS
ncbi:MAG: cyclodeaminase [Deltaproteobacteria bacterium]|nr:cyclodeaminase [Deltaproteobacteria bacterium]